MDALLGAIGAPAIPSCSGSQQGIAVFGAAIEGIYVDELATAGAERLPATACLRRVRCDDLEAKSDRKIRKGQQCPMKVFASWSCFSTMSLSI